MDDHKNKFPLLMQITGPDDLKHLCIQQLEQLAAEVRSYLIGSVQRTGGHLGSNLGVVELTIALHYLLAAPKDHILWDVGHQSYVHKMLTGRLSEMGTLRQEGGISGFTCRSESIYDPFGAAHSSTSISAALGIAWARQFKGDDSRIACIIGDGALSAGMAFEALNNVSGLQKQQFLIIINDNDMSIAPPVGNIRQHLTNLRQKDKGDHSSNIFTDMGCHYLPPVDGHNMAELLTVLQQALQLQEPVVAHVVTRKGKGYPAAEQAKDCGHSVTACAEKSTPNSPIPKSYSYGQVFAQTLVDVAETDDKIVAVTAAMPDGTGLNHFMQHFPQRCFDVGIAEQHAVTFAAGLASQGMRPFAAIYSTFLQRAYDQVVHDVALQNLPVRFAIDRAGLVGADGATHAGSFDIAYLGCLPNFVLMAPVFQEDVQEMTMLAAAYDESPIAFRYPRGSASVAITAREVVQFGKGCILSEGNSPIALLGYGHTVLNCIAAAEYLRDHHDINVTVADARFAKPLDNGLLTQLLHHHNHVIIVEEGSIGGLGSFVRQWVYQNMPDKQNAIETFCLPDHFISQATQTRQQEQAKLDSQTLIHKIIALCQNLQKTGHVLPV